MSTYSRSYPRDRDRYYYVPYYADESAQGYYYPEVSRVAGRVGNSKKKYIVRRLKKDPKNDSNISETSKTTRRFKKLKNSNF